MDVKFTFNDVRQQQFNITVFDFAKLEHLTYLRIQYRIIASKIGDYKSPHPKLKQKVYRNFLSGNVYNPS